MSEKQAGFEPPVGPRVTLCSDGKYRWVYGMHLLKNPTVFLLVWKIFFYILLVMAVLMVVSDGIRWGFTADRLLGTLKVMGYILLGMTALVGLGCLVYAAMMGWQYVVEFEMDDAGVTHRQVAAQARKAQKLSLFTTAVGAATGSLTAMGAGMNAGTEMHSEFARVRRVRAYPRRNVIKVDAPFCHNQVYARAEDFAFVQEYIVSRCVNAKK